MVGSPSDPAAVHEPRLWRALGLDAPGDGRPVVALVGGGGKSTLLYRLGRDAEALGRAAILCGTVRYTRAPHAHAMPTIVRGEERALPGQVAAALRGGARVVVATGIDADHPARLVSIAPDTVDAIAHLDGLGVVAIEADGSRQLPFKAPDTHEPVIPASATHVVALVGAEAIGAPLDAAYVHRPERIRAIVDRPVCDADLIARVLADPRGGRQYVAGRAFTVVVNKADLNPAGAADLARRLVDLGVPRVVIARLADEADPVEDVLLRDAGEGGRA